MREIKFRCWFNNQMHNVESIDFQCQTVNINAPYRVSFMECEIMQYTGLKDKNGVEIYEGDIVKCKLLDQIKKNGKWINVETFEKYEVIYSEDDLGFRFKDEWMAIWKFENCELEVIGNIYENKLKEEGK